MAAKVRTSDATPDSLETGALPERLSDRVKARARELGFDLVGIAPAVSPAGVTHLRSWLERGYAGEMHYMERQAAAREHPRHVLQGVRSVVMAAMNYRTADPPPREPLTGRVSCYAWGGDYHAILRDRLKRLGGVLHELAPGCRTRVVVDTAPLLERDFARLAGLGWIGKNTMLLSKRLGSWLFLGAVLVDIELEPDEPHAADHCGTCTRCLDACPTGAFAGPGQLDSRRCISYLTIELGGPMPPGLSSGVGDWLFGCDVCQEVCPWNRKAPLSREPGFRPLDGHDRVDLIWLLGASDAELKEWIGATTMERAGTAGLRRNAAVALGNSGSAEAIPALSRALGYADEGVRDAAAWALERIRTTESPTSTSQAERKNMP